MSRVLRWWGGATEAVGSVTAWLLVAATLATALAAVVVTAGHTARPPAIPAAAPSPGTPAPGTPEPGASLPSSTSSPTPHPPDASAASTPRPMPSWSAPEEVLPPGDLDPATVPWGQVERAVALLQLHDSGPDQVTVVADAATGGWVRPVGLDLTTTAQAELSPDGRSVLVRRFSTNAVPWLEAVTLATGATRRLATPGDCLVDAGAWAPDGQHVAMVLGCVEGSRLVEVNPATGAQHEVERVAGAYPEEVYPSYSPDGRYYVYSLVTDLVPGQDDDDVWPGLRVVDLRTGTARTFDGAHVTYGDPWRDGSTLLAWDELGGLSAGEDAGGLVLLHADSGSAEAFDGDRGDGLGFAGGVRLLDGDACATAVCVDVPDGTPRPWLRLPDGWGLWGTAPSLARDAFVAG